MDEEVTATQAAALTGLSERTIRRKIAAGTLRARRVAPNRFAIAVSDLPKRRGVEALVARVEDLERRVERLEAAIGAGVGSQAAVDVLPAGTDAASNGPVGPLRELLGQLAREVERLSPLLGADAPLPAPSADDAAGWREGRGQARRRRARQ